MGLLDKLKNLPDDTNNICYWYDDYGHSHDKYIKAIFQIIGSYVDWNNDDFFYLMEGVVVGTNEDGMKIMLDRLAEYEQKQIIKQNFQDIIAEFKEIQKNNPK